MPGLTRAQVIEELRHAHALVQPPTNGQRDRTGCLCTLSPAVVAWLIDNLTQEPSDGDVGQVRADRDSWAQQASDRTADWHTEHQRAERLEEALRYAVEQVPELATVPGIAAALTPNAAQPG